MDKFPVFIARLEQRLRLPLPGLEVQLRMATMRRKIKEGKMDTPQDARKSAVLVLFYTDGVQIKLVFMKRPEYPGVHSGQVSFPGGGFEFGDIDLVATAKREAEEEIGIKRETVTTIGFLSDLYIPPSNFLVTPVVGYTREQPVFKPDPAEVDEVIEVALDDLLQDQTLCEKDITVYPGTRIRVPCFYVNGHVIWGATAMILSELVLVIREATLSRG